METSWMNFDDRNVTSSMQLDVIAFDCDGVLFDSSEANVRFYNHILYHIGWPITVQPEQREYIHMHPVKESLRFLLGENHSLHDALDYVRELDFRPFNMYLKCEPGLLEVLELAKSAYHTALATNRTISTHEVLAYYDLNKYFDIVVSASDVLHPKPHPEIMERILKNFDVSPEQILYVGDSPVDEEFAMATGVVFAAYKNPKLKAHLHVNHFDELRPVLLAGAGNGGKAR